MDEVVGMIGVLCYVVCVLVELLFVVCDVFGCFDLVFECVIGWVL